MILTFTIPIGIVHLAPRYLRKIECLEPMDIENVFVVVRENDERGNPIE